MIDPTPPRAAAWAPWLDGQRHWLLDRESRAADWLTQRAAAEKSRLIVQGASHAQHYRVGTSPSAAIARRGSVATYRSPVRGGATYADNVDIQLLATAMSTADGNSLVATESPTFPLVGWAMAVGAINLGNGQVTEDERTHDQIELLNDFVDQLYNGWGHRESWAPGRRLLPPKAHRIRDELSSLRRVRHRARPPSPGIEQRHRPHAQAHPTRLVHRTPGTVYRSAAPNQPSGWQPTGDPGH